MTTPNEIANEAREIVTSPGLRPGSEPASVVLAELIRNLAQLVTDLAEQVEELAARH